MSSPSSRRECLSPMPLQQSRLPFFASSPPSFSTASLLLLHPLPSTFPLSSSALQPRCRASTRRRRSPLSPMSSLLLLYPLPQVPDGVNPYAYYSAFAKSVVYRQVPDSRGFKIRLVVLFCLLGYLILGAAAYLVLAVVDSRRRKKELFLWKLVRRKKGRYIVGKCVLFSSFLFL